jgi:hypothetical protein
MTQCTTRHTRSDLVTEDAKFLSRRAACTTRAQDWHQYIPTDAKPHLAEHCYHNSIPASMHVHMQTHAHRQPSGCVQFEVYNTGTSRHPSPASRMREQHFNLKPELRWAQQRSKLLTASPALPAALPEAIAHKSATTAAVLDPRHTLALTPWHSPVRAHVRHFTTSISTQATTTLRAADLLQLIGDIKGCKPHVGCQQHCSAAAAMPESPARHIAHSHTNTTNRHLLISSFAYSRSAYMVKTQQARCVHIVWHST